ncbi:MAG: hypothetical protein U9R72_14500, partial [Chloroflexota bacterium]|nr:hypothetical protein [Chloroflexota bacterium]
MDQWKAAVRTGGTEAGILRESHHKERELMWSESAVADRLLELTGTLHRSELFPSYDPRASELVGT